MKIQPRPVGTASVSVPGSKSLSHRFLAAAALSDGDCIIENCLISEDTLLTMDGLRQMGVTMRVAGEQIQVRGKNGRFSACQQPVYLGNSGTSLRFFCALAALGEGLYTITGTQRMYERPIQDLLDGLMRDPGCGKIHKRQRVPAGNHPRRAADRRSHCASVR